MRIADLFKTRRQTPEPGDDAGVSPLAPDLAANEQVRRRQRMLLASAAAVGLALSCFWIFSGDEPEADPQTDEKSDVTVSTRDLVNRNLSQQEWMALSEQQFERQENQLRLALAHEFQALASLRHPNIIAVRDYGFDQTQQPYFTMELLPQARSLVDAGQWLPVDGKIDLLAQLLSALVYIHRRAIAGIDGDGAARDRLGDEIIHRIGRDRVDAGIQRGRGRHGRLVGAVGECEAADIGAAGGVGYGHVVVDVA